MVQLEFRENIKVQVANIILNIRLATFHVIMKSTDMFLMDSTSV